jgi:hypothetical protein
VHVRLVLAHKVSRLCAPKKVQSRRWAGNYPKPPTPSSDAARVMFLRQSDRGLGMLELDSKTVSWLLPEYFGKELGAQYEQEQRQIVICYQNFARIHPASFTDHTLGFELPGHNSGSVRTDSERKFEHQNRECLSFYDNFDGRNKEFEMAGANRVVHAVSLTPKWRINCPVGAMGAVG